MAVVLLQQTPRANRRSDIHRLVRRTRTKAPGVFDDKHLPARIILRSFGSPSLLDDLTQLPGNATFIKVIVQTWEHTRDFFDEVAPPLGLSVEPSIGLAASARPTDRPLAQFATGIPIRSQEPAVRRAPFQDMRST
jgi:hypothetical protein